MCRSIPANAWARQRGLIADGFDPRLRRSRSTDLLPPRWRHPALTKVKRFRGWTGQDFYSAPEVWADSRETCTIRGDDHTLAGTNNDMSRFRAMRRRGV